METRGPAVYRRAGRRQRSWLSAKHDSRQDARLWFFTGEWKQKIHIHRQNSINTDSSTISTISTISSKITHTRNKIPHTH
ncbi:hypothetical protein MKleb_5649 (plasmid) [Klebsiella sp. PL-2018]|nr:hypothetical protein MKleb_5649 [Klebsiella sp. PL-2018]